MKSRFAIATILLFVTLACSGVADVMRLLTPTYAWATATSPRPTAALQDTAQPTTDIQAANPTPTLTVDPVCVPPNSPAPLVETGFDAYPDAILGYLNDGDTASSLQAALEALGIANPPIPVAEGDLNGDGSYDLAASILDLGAQEVQPPGELLVYLCRGGQYELAYSELSAEFYAAPAILRLQDLNADGSAEIIYSSSTCGAHTCFESAHILAWTGTDFEDRLQGTTEELPSPNLQITDYDLDGIYDLEVAAQGYGSVGAGPQRTITQIWSYDPATGFWVPGEQMLGPSNFRIHVLHDADDAMRRGEYAIAILLYDQVINDDDLVDWVDEPTERLNLGAYARYKTVVAYALQGDTVQAQNFLDAIAPLFPVGIPQHAYVEMAEAFLNAFLTGGQEAGCAAAQTYAAANAQVVLVPLGSQTYGYANPDYLPTDVCP